MIPRPCGVRRWWSLIHSIMQKDKPMCSKKRVQYVFIFAMRWDSDFPDNNRPGPPEDEAALWSGSMGANTERVSYLTIISFMGWYGRNHEGILGADVTHNSQLWMSKNQPRVRSHPVPLISVGMTLSWWHHYVVGYGWTTRLRKVEAWGLRSRYYQ